MRLQELEESRKQRDKGDRARVIRTEAAVYGGYSIGRDGKKIVFIRGAIPGELVEVSIGQEKSDYSTAVVTAVIEPSAFRREPPCPVFGICGGCQLQFAVYDRQVSMKEEVLRDALGRIGGIGTELLPAMRGEELRYRRRAQFKVSREGNIGFYTGGTRDLVPIEECPLMVGEINGILHKLKVADLRGVKELHISFGDTAVVLVKGGMSEETSQELLEKGVSGIAFENGDSIGRDYITLDLNGLRYTVTPWSFFQSHWSLNRAVVDFVVGELAPLENRRVLDLYAGAGNFALPVSQFAREVSAVEENYYAVEDGRRNAMLNGIRNCDFIQMSVEESLYGKKGQKAARLLTGGRFDVVMLDPPRTGLTSDVVRAVLEMKAEDIAYLSCNPATLARDLKKMKELYDIRSVRMIDFFPNTYHIEALAFLKLK